MRAAHRPAVGATGDADRAMVGAYSDTAEAWAAGPGTIYDHLAAIALDSTPGGLAGRVVLDLGTGTGAAARAAVEAGASAVVGLDAAPGMLARDARSRPPAVLADARLLPFGPGAFDVVVAAFCLNHLPDPVTALAEVGRILRSGGALVATAYADDDQHQVKALVDRLCVDRGWRPPRWYADLRGVAMPLLSTPERAERAARAAGLIRVRARRRRVAFPAVTPVQLVRWRLGMAHLAPFVADLSEADRRELVSDAVDRLEVSAAPLVRSMVVLTASA